jgi:anhydro-N-acetylmuramic acid kinase
MAKHSGIGIMTGTSMDGVDLVSCTFEEKNNKWKWNADVTACAPIPKKIKQSLRDLAHGSAVEYAQLHAHFGDFLGRTVASFIRAHKLRPQWVASHGQTIFHQPHRGFTAQIGDGEVIATHVKCPVVTQFRAKDVAVGGQGAPLVPFGEKHLFPAHNLFLNLGGICNVSMGRIAFDVAPCNLVMNQFARLRGKTMDRDGKFAANGTTHTALLKKLNSLPFYHTTGPRSLGTEWIEESFMPVLLGQGISTADCMRTFTEHVAIQIAQALKKNGVKRGNLLATGGGAKNKFLLSRIALHLDKIKVKLSEETSTEVVDFKEAIIFAFLGLMRIQGRTNTLPAVTGARRAVCAGVVSLGI